MEFQQNKLLHPRRRKEMAIKAKTEAQRLALSEISPRIFQSEIRAMSVECDRIGGVNLAQGICDTDVPAVVAESAINAIREGKNIYTRLDGIAILREAIADKFARHNHLEVDPEEEVLVSAGATGAFHATAMALLNPGDEVILFEPFYGYHVSTLLSQRMVPVPVPLTAPDWDLNIAEVRAAITPKTRALVLNTPANPSGKVFSRRELEELAHVAIEFDLYVITDEIYEYFLFDGTQHISIATLPGMQERTITISGFSKTFSVTGWRLGYLSASNQWLPSIGYFHDLAYVCAPSPLQHGAAAGLLGLPDAFYQALRTEFAAKRDRLVTALIQAGFTPSVPSGAYYILAEASHIEGATAKEKARTLLARTGVASVAGSAFFQSGQGESLLRFCFAKKDDALDEACRRLVTL
jgi:aminotransferase